MTPISEGMHIKDPPLVNLDSTKSDDVKGVVGLTVPLEYCGETSSRRNESVEARDNRLLLSSARGDESVDMKLVVIEGQLELDAEENDGKLSMSVSIFIVCLRVFRSSMFAISPASDRSSGG